MSAAVEETWRWKYYIVDTRQVVGNFALFWGKNRCGYVCDLNDAGEYEEAEALEIQASRGTDVAIPCEEVRALVRMHVRADSPGWRMVRDKADLARATALSGRMCGDLYHDLNSPCCAPHDDPRRGTVWK